MYKKEEEWTTIPLKKIQVSQFCLILAYMYLLFFAHLLVGRSGSVALE